MSPQLRIGIVAGEASGDILGAGLIKALKQTYPAAIFEGIGGPLMEAEGFNSHFPQERLAVMGLVEPLKRLPELLRIRKSLRKHFIKQPPAVFIGIDSPDFNLNLEGKLKAAGIPAVHYVSPSVWAWRQKRIVKIAKSVDLMLTLFPFEEKFYQQHQVPVKFVGHPLADDFPLEAESVEARAQLGLAADARVVALLPGSRGGEVRLLGDVFFDAAALIYRTNPEVSFLVPAANAARKAQIEAQLSRHPDLPVHLLDQQSQTAMRAADVVLMASGTTTLECLLLKRPMVVSYKMAPLSYAIIWRLVKTPFVALPNILAGRELVPEILQDDVSAESLSEAVLEYLNNDEAAAALKSEFLAIHKSLRCHASQQAASAIRQLIETERHDH